MNNKYEIMFIVKPQIPAAVQEEIKNKLTAKIIALKGTVQSFAVWKELWRLAFPLQTSGAGREKYHEAAYWLLTFELPVEHLTEFKEVIRLEENILRNLIIRVKG